MMNEVYTILIVDDEEPALKLMSRLLSCDRYTLHTAGNGREALELAEKINPDLILLDVIMPGLDGAETCRILKSTEGIKLIPVIMLTACQDKEVKLRCLSAGANDFLAKPVDNAELQLRVHNMLEFRRHTETRKWVERLLQIKKTMEGKNRELEAALEEIERTQTQIIQQEKMASVGQIAAGVAHEINNPMGYISSNMNSLFKYAEKLAQFIDIQEQAIEKSSDEETKKSITELKRQIKLDFVMKDFRDLIAESLEGSKRVSKIVQDLKSFSRIDGDEAIPADLNTYIQSTINVVRNEIKYVAELDIRLGDIPLVVCRPQQISQVVMNLLVNAAHSISSNGVITIATTHVKNTVEISVTDTGCGISPENISKIFEPFFTTKEVGKGTGLGLAISRDIVRKHGGELLVMSETGKGTVFTVQLPLQ
ncbi:MAG: response regulator [Desulfuromonadaceae bacterium]|nr:response regulator [Desulfuromonadaceae bacterium]MDD2847265.1 response regulator [Desulfuromonadaceae bacterium]MDD4130209.1 response regulator [Desulfuromonadaceae bacterium]